MGGSKTTVQNQGTTTQTIPAEIRERGTKITNAAMNNYFDPASKYSPFDYSTYTGVGQGTTGQLNSMNGQGGQADQSTRAAGSDYQPYYDAAGTTAAGTYTNGPNYSTSTVNQFQNPWDQDVINAGLRNIGTGLTSQMQQNSDAAAKAGAFGGARHGVIDAMSQRTAAQTMSDYIAQQEQAGFKNAQDQYNTNQSQTLAANNQNQSLAQLFANLGTGRSNQDIASGKAATDLGNIWTAQDQAQKDNAYEKGYLDQRNYPMDIYEQLASINAMQPINRTSTTSGSSTQSQSGGWIGPAISAAGSIIAASDERVKEDIADVDAEETLGAFSQIKPKTYRYSDDVLASHPNLTRPGPRTGFMAQDAERAFKHPVGPEVDGIKTVDVGQMLGKVMVAIHGLEKRTRNMKPRAKA